MNNSGENINAGNSSGTPGKSNVPTTTSEKVVADFGRSKLPLNNPRAPCQMNSSGGDINAANSSGTPEKKAEKIYKNTMPDFYEVFNPQEKEEEKGKVLVFICMCNGCKRGNKAIKYKFKDIDKDIDIDKVYFGIKCDDKENIIQHHCFDDLRKKLEIIKEGTGKRTIWWVTWAVLIIIGRVKVCFIDEECEKTAGKTDGTEHAEMPNGKKKKKPPVIVKVHPDEEGIKTTLATKLDNFLDKNQSVEGFQVIIDKIRPVISPFLKRNPIDPVVPPSQTARLEQPEKDDEDLENVGEAANDQGEEEEPPPTSQPHSSQNLKRQRDGMDTIQNSIYKKSSSPLKKPCSPHSGRSSPLGSSPTMGQFSSNLVYPEQQQQQQIQQVLSDQSINQQQGIQSLQSSSNGQSTNCISMNAPQFSISYSVPSNLSSCYSQENLQGYCVPIQPPQDSISSNELTFTGSSDSSISPHSPAEVLVPNSPSDIIGSIENEPPLTPQLEQSQQQDQYVAQQQYQQDAFQQSLSPPSQNSDKLLRNNNFNQNQLQECRPSSCAMPLQAASPSYNSTQPNGQLRSQSACPLSNHPPSPPPQQSQQSQQQQQQQQQQQFQQSQQTLSYQCISSGNGQSTNCFSPDSQQLPPFSSSVSQNPLCYYPLPPPPPPPPPPQQFQQGNYGSIQNLPPPPPPLPQQFQQGNYGSIQNLPPPLLLHQQFQQQEEQQQQQQQRYMPVLVPIPTNEEFNDWLKEYRIDNCANEKTFCCDAIFRDTNQDYRVHMIHCIPLNESNVPEIGIINYQEHITSLDQVEQVMLNESIPECNKKSLPCICFVEICGLVWIVIEINCVPLEITLDGNGNPLPLSHLENNNQNSIVLYLSISP